MNKQSQALTISEVQFSKLTKFANMGLSVSEISTIVNIPETELTRIIETPEFKSDLSELKLKTYERQEVVNNGWEKAEELSLNTVIKQLTSIPDPEYALKVAKLAREINHQSKLNENAKNNPIDARPNNESVIYLQPTFAAKLQQNFIINDDKKPLLEKKIVNVLDLESAKALLNSKASEVLNQAPIESVDHILEAVDTKT